LELNEVPVVIDRRKILALLAYLAINPWKHHRDHISALFWPEYPQPKAFTNLRHILWEVRQVIGNDWIVAGRDTIALAAKSSATPERTIWVDVERFELLKAQGNAQSDSSLRLDMLSEAIKLYRNHFLTGFTLKDAPDFNEWASAESEKLRDQLARVLAILIEDLCALGQAGGAIPYAQRLVALDPLNEVSHRLLMEIYLQAGQHSAALRQYELCRNILRKELGVDPQPETRLLYKQIRR
jgi:DNA-binding SARP family transcriptional activator